MTLSFRGCSARGVCRMLAVALVCSALAWCETLVPTPAGLPRNQALYVAMRDGVKIAIDVWLPATLEPGQRVPTIVKHTPNWRAIGLVKQTGAMKLLSYTGVVPTDDFNLEEANAVGAAGYAIVYADARGTGASFGVRTQPFSTNEISDFGEIVEWISKQPWSNGKVGALGIQYDGTAAELVVGLKRPALKAAAPLYSDFDPWVDNIAPGGVLNDWFLRFWRDGARMLDTNDLVAVAKYRNKDYDMLKRVISGVKRVDEDPEGVQLAAAIKERSANVDIYEAGRKLEFRDDPFGATGVAFDALSPCGLRSAIEGSNTPMYVSASWLDAGTARGALSRFATFKNPQIVVIGPWSHGGKTDVDPFKPVDAAIQPGKEQRLAEYLAFFDAYLKDNASGAAMHEVRYYTMGEGKWKKTPAWPLPSTRMERWYFAPEGGLSRTAPTDPNGADTYTVDFTATTGNSNRWRTQADGEDVVYSDRAAQDAKLLVYTSAALETDTEITGHPVITLNVASTASDGAFFAYLEAVNPDGTVTYLTEGMLRAVHRKVSTDSPPYAVFGPYHTFNRADALPLVPGEPAEIAFDLFPTSVLLKKGSRLRVAVAGHDASVFARYPAGDVPTLTVNRSAQNASHIDIPTIPR
ncbi:MAG: CocE/NonD family hydrolase [Candidatus Hydrogenedentes bacterium]|nr:CocE/NonD family hydrolase [Candidatus Hydrogenedentota bacterium]